MARSLDNNFFCLFLQNPVMKAFISLQKNSHNFSVSLTIILLRPCILLEKKEVLSVTNARWTPYIGSKMAARFRVGWGGGVDCDQRRRAIVINVRGA